MNPLGPVPESPAVSTQAASQLTLQELSRAVAVQVDFILQAVQEGLIEPVAGDAPESWRFTVWQLQRVSVAWRLQCDLGVNLPGAALALQLLDEVQALRAQSGAEAGR